MREERGHERGQERREGVREERGGERGEEMGWLGISCHCAIHAKDSTHLLQWTPGQAVREDMRGERRRAGWASHVTAHKPPEVIRTIGRNPR